MGSSWSGSHGNEDDAAALAAANEAALAAARRHRIRQQLNQAHPGSPQRPGSHISDPALLGDRNFVGGKKTGCGSGP